MKQLLTKRNILLITLWILYFVCFTVLFPLTRLTPNQFIPYAEFLTPVRFVLFFSCLIVIACIVYNLPRYLDGLTVKTAFVLIALFSIPFFLSYPGDSTDFFVNMWQAERVITYHENPYASTLDTSNYPDHDFLPSIQQDVHLPYGPVWLAIQTPLYSLVNHTSILAATIFFKFIFLFLWLLFSYLMLAIITRSNTHVLKEITTLLISPLPLAAIIGNMHNDIFLLLFLVGMCVFLLQKKHALAITFFLLGVFTKFIGSIFLPILLLFYWLSGRQSKIIGGVLCFITLACMTLAEWQLGFLHGIFDQTSLFGGSIILALSHFVHSDVIVAIRSGYYALFALVYGIVLYYMYITHLNSRLTEKQLLQWAGFIITIAIILLVHFFAYQYMLWLIPFLIVYNRPGFVRFYAFVCSIILTVMLMTFVIYSNSYGVGFNHIHVFDILTVNKAYLGLFLLSHILISSLVLYVGYRMFRYLTTNENLTS